jgi:predicted anti-sigma-YlaC factor YlaD
MLLTVFIAIGLVLMFVLGLFFAMVPFFIARDHKEGENITVTFGAMLLSWLVSGILIFGACWLARLADL